MQTDLIIVNEYCRICHIEPSFIFRLEEGGLIEIRIIEGEKYLQAEQLHDIERYTRMYYDLSINFEGIDAVTPTYFLIAQITRINYQPYLTITSLLSSKRVPG